jgi:hypothetical protein
MHNQIDNILIDRRQHSSILDVRSFIGADCDSDDYLVVAKVRERLAVSKRMVKKMDMERFNLKKLNELEVKEQYRVTIKNKFAALEYLEDNGDISTVEYRTLAERTSKFLCESKPWFAEECSKLAFHEQEKGMFKRLN